MKVLVTGGTGTISSCLVEECVKRGYETYAFTRGNMKWREVENAHYYHGDIWNYEKTQEILGEDRFDIVVECIVYSEEQLRISLSNFENRTNLYVFISTSGIFKRTEQAIKEDTELDFSGWSYTDNKIRCEEILKEYCMGSGLNYMIIRPSITYGKYRVPFPVATRKPGWSFYQRMLAGKPMLACDNVKAQMVYVDDFSESVVNLFTNTSSINNDYNISLNEEEHWDNVILAACEILEIEPFIIHVPLEIIRKVYPEIYEELKWNKVDDLIMDGSKIKEASGLRQGRVSLKEGIRRSIEMMKQEYENNWSRLDEDWNNKCDQTIKQAYSENSLSDEEMKILDSFYRKSEE